jgi:hypothetical protein
MASARSAHIDPFYREHLPPCEQWPELWSTVLSCSTPNTSSAGGRRAPGTSAGFPAGRSRWSDYDDSRCRRVAAARSAS